MSRVRTQNTNHSYMRAAERCGWCRREAREITKKASRYGISWGTMKPSPLRDYIADKQLGSPHKRIKFYNNYIFVFASTSDKCITVYPVPPFIK